MLHNFKYFYIVELQNVLFFLQYTINCYSNICIYEKDKIIKIHINSYIRNHINWHNSCCINKLWIRKKYRKSIVAITANENSTFALTYKALGISVDLQYSKDKTNRSSYSNEVSINQGQTLYLKGNNPAG